MTVQLSVFFGVLMVILAVEGRILRKNRIRREIIAFFAFFLLGAVCNFLYIIDVRIPSPIKAAEVLFQVFYEPVADWVTGGHA